jgi:hypothetical protein
MGAPGVGRQQDPRDAASSRTSATEGQPAWTSLCLQHQGATQPRDVDCRPGGAKLRTIRVAMETTAAILVSVMKKSLVHLIRRAQMLPVLSREVVEGEQHVAILD